MLLGSVFAVDATLPMRPAPQRQSVQRPGARPGMQMLYVHPSGARGHRQAVRDFTDAEPLYQVAGDSLLAGGQCKMCSGFVAPGDGMP